MDALFTWEILFVKIKFEGPLFSKSASIQLGISSIFLQRPSQLVMENIVSVQREALLLKLILVRHGQTVWNREKRAQGISDIELSEHGRSQAECLALSLRDEKIDRIISSPLKRAVETAEVINRFHQLPIHTEDGLMELNMGDFEGIALGRMSHDHEEFLKRWVDDPASVVMPGGESLADLQRRSWGAVQPLIGKTGTTLLASHNFTIMTILSMIKGVDLAGIRQFHVDVGSKTVVNFVEERGDVLLFNDVSHLKDCNDVDP